MLSRLLSLNASLIRPTLRHLSTSCQVSMANRLLFNTSHEWVRLDDQAGNTAVVGISNYAQGRESLGDVVYAQLPETESAVAAGEACGDLESVKAVSQIYSPVTGTVVAKNEAVESAPALINSAPMGDGWLFKVKLADAENELKKLMDEQQYEDFLKSQEDEH